MTNKNKNELKAILISFKTIMVFLSIISIILWIAGPCLNLISSTDWIRSTWSDNGLPKTVYTYYHLLYVPQYQTIPVLGKVARNTSIFTEAPMFSYNLSISLMTSFFIEKEDSINNRIILSLAIITSFSTAGYLVLVICCFYYIYTYENNNAFFNRLKKVCIPIVILFGLIVSSYLVVSKLQSGSGSTRIDDLRAGYAVFKEHPIFGSGFGNLKEIQKHMSAFRMNNIGYSNSVLQVLANGGLYLSLIYFGVCFYGFYRIIKKRDISLLFFVLTFVFVFAVTIIPYQLITIYLIMYCVFI